ncbi:CBL-interacting protein kinase 2-like [Primulina huaijiensis]|uniref:CBL-interacting protein kinase 2-like n=1 Tax=Primulina huaijiensis TaxID=1492673 RepID=UPI003CC78428
MESKGSVLMKQYEVGKLLGQGTFAKVYHARNLKTDASVAVKIVDKEKIYKAGMIDQIKREISVMRLVNHPNIVQLYEVMASKTKIFFVMEYVKGGELFNKVAKGKLKEDAARKYYQQLISAVDFCHSRGVYHRDLKPENLLLDENGNLKVSDFGFSALAESKRQDGLLHTTCGTPAYVAPEVINRRGYDGSKADIWSCGVILYVLLAGYLPFHDSNLMEMYRKIGKAEFKFPNWISPDARKLISKMLDPSLNTRISISKIMENLWFRKGFQSKIPWADAYSKNSNIETEKKTAIDADATLKADIDRLTSLNAFDIISLSTGFDLSGLFEENDNKRDFRFTSDQPAKNIISRMEDLAKRLKLKIMNKDGGLLKFEGSKCGRKGTLSVDAEIFEIAPDFHLVEMKKASGDTLEFQKMMRQDVRTSLKDIVWTWQGNKPHADPQLELSESQPSQVP